MHAFVSRFSCTPLLLQLTKHPTALSPLIQNFYWWVSINWSILVRPPPMYIISMFFSLNGSFTSSPRWPGAVSIISNVFGLPKNVPGLLLSTFSTINTFVIVPPFVPATAIPAGKVHFDAFWRFLKMIIGGSLNPLYSSLSVLEYTQQNNATFRILLTFCELSSHLWHHTFCSLACQKTLESHPYFKLSHNCEPHVLSHSWILISYRKRPPEREVIECRFKNRFVQPELALNLSVLFG